MKKLQPLHLLLATGGLASAMLVGCGGGGSDAAAPPPVTPAAETVNVNSTVVDGAIGNALVCLDLNSNGACDTGEPSARTDANGNSTLVVAKADAGKFPVIAIVGTDAVDKDNGPVKVGFTMKAPADASGVVSPLTTLVQAHIESSQLGTAAAEAAVKDQLGVTVSLLADFTKATDDASKLAATVARLVVITKQTQVTATAGATGTGGVALTQAQIEAAVNTRLLQLLPSILQAASDPAVQAASSPAAKEAALLAAAQALATAAGLTKENLGAVVATNTRPVTADSTDNGAGNVLRWFSFSDLNNYVVRAFRTSAAQAVVDAGGKRHFDEYRERSVNGVHSVWNPDADDNATPWLRNQVYWTGTEWFDCPTNFVHDATPWSATGESESLYCKAYKSKSKRTARDVAGVKMIDLVKEIRAYPLFDNAGSYANWGPNPSDTAIVAALGDKTFPAGSKLYYQSGIPLVNPDAYGTTSNDLAKIVPANIATGDATACANYTSANSASFQSDAATLDQVIARAPGLPCAYTANASTGTRNESWGSTTVGIGDQSVAAFEVPSSVYKNNVLRIRAAFGANNTVTYLSCLARASDNSARNCSPIGTGSYSVETVGDARVLRLANAPASAATLGYNRILVERGGKVWYGSRDKLATTNQLRLNGGGADALLAALGLN